MLVALGRYGGGGRGEEGGGEGVLMGRGRGEGDEEIKCHGKDVMTSVLWSVLQPVPNSGHDTAERPVAPFTLDSVTGIAQ